MDVFQTTESWKHMYPEACAGVLVMRGVINPPSHAGLDARRTALEEDIRGRYAGMDRKALEADPVLAAYAAYYRKFRKTYHVLLQLESVVSKGQSIPSGPALVQAMFTAELKNLLLTAGHDLDRLSLPLTLAVSRGRETYTTLRGQPQALKTGDMLITDEVGIISSIIYGPDERTQIRPQTTSVLFTVYGPPGIRPEAVRQHLVDLEENVRVISPHAQTGLLEVTLGSPIPG